MADSVTSEQAAYIRSQSLSWFDAETYLGHAIALATYMKCVTDGTSTTDPNVMALLQIIERSSREYQTRVDAWAKKCAEIDARMAPKLEMMENMRRVAAAPARYIKPMAGETRAQVETRERAASHGYLTIVGEYDFRAGGYLRAIDRNALATLVMDIVVSEKKPAEPVPPQFGSICFYQQSNIINLGSGVTANNIKQINAMVGDDALFNVPWNLEHPTTMPQENGRHKSALVYFAERETRLSDQYLPQLQRIANEKATYEELSVMSTLYNNCSSQFASKAAFVDDALQSFLDRLTPQSLLVERERIQEEQYEIDLVIRDAKQQLWKEREDEELRHTVHYQRILAEMAAAGAGSGDTGGTTGLPRTAILIGALVIGVGLAYVAVRK